MSALTFFNCCFGDQALRRGDPTNSTNSLPGQNASTNGMLDQSPFPLTNALHELPPLVLELVLAQLAEHDLGRLACTSRTLRAAVDQDVTWRHVYHTAHADSQELLNSAAALTAAGRSWRQVVLYAAPSITAVVGGLGGSSFDTANFAYSRDLMGCRVRGNQQTSLPSWSSPCPALAAPCLSPRTCRVLACVRLWVSVQARDPPHIRAMQLRYHNPANPAIGTWTHRIGAHDEDGQRPSEATHALELAEGEHITCVRCFEGWCCWAG